MAMDIKDKIALITGGADGIGLAITKELLQEGAKVVICDVNAQKGKETVKKLNAEHGKDKAVFIHTDVSNCENFKDAFKETKRLQGIPDIVINNAGIFNEQKWEQLVDINLKGVILGTFLALEYMGKDKGGKGGVVVNIASICGLETLAAAPVYNATKHGVIAFSRTLGNPFHFELSSVRVLALCPGVTTTALLASAALVYDPEWLPEWERLLCTLPVQSPEYVGKAAVEIIRNAAPGTVWVTEDGQPVWEVDKLDRHALKRQC